MAGVRTGATRSALALVSACVLALGVSQQVPALGDTAPPAGTPATVSADGLPTWQVDGVIWSQVVIGNTVYAVGSFSKARPPGVAVGGVGEVAAANIFAFDITTGNRVAYFNHSLNAQARVITASPDGSRIYVGGDFTSVDGAAHGHVAAFITSTSALDPTFRATGNGGVRGLAASASTLFIGGNYTSMDGVARKSLSAVSSSGGSLLPWAPTVDNGNVWSMVLAPDQSRVIVGGSFTTLNGQPAYGMGSLDASSGLNLPWAANQTIRDATENGAITSLRTDGRQIYGSGYSFGSGTNFEGTFAADPATGIITVVNDCHGDTYDVLPLGAVLYSVSHAHDCTWVGGFPDTNPRVRWQRALAQTIAATRSNTGPDSYGWNYAGRPASTILQWFPQIDTGTYTGQNQGAWSLAGNSNYVVLGGEFPKINNIAQQGLVRMALSSLAPNKRGPRYDTKPARPIPPTNATSTASGSVTVSFGTWWDYDNAVLTYDVLRDNTSYVYSTQVGTNFWTLPNKTFTDTGLVSGSSHYYQVRIRDPFGNIQWSPVSNTVTVR